MMPKQFVPALHNLIENEDETVNASMENQQTMGGGKNL